MKHRTLFAILICSAMLVLGTANAAGSPRLTRSYWFKPAGWLRTSTIRTLSYFTLHVIGPLMTRATFQGRFLSC